MKLKSKSSFGIKFFVFVLLSLFFSLVSAPIFAQGIAGFETPLKFQKSLSLKAGTATYELSPVEISAWIRSQESLRFQPTYLSEIENVDVCQKLKSISCELEFSFLNRYRIRKYQHFSIDWENLNLFVTDLARKINKDPLDAKLKFENEKISIATPAEEGISLNVEKSSEIIKNYYQKEIILDELGLDYEKIAPAISTESLEKLGIKSLIGEGRSNFRGSPKNRIFNIEVATKRFEGIIIKPEEEFSFIKILGEVDGEHGYKEELVIKKDKTEPEFGGGICQVSTTVFRAAIYSGLKITARRNHAYPVQYYNPQGIDATVYVPSPDLRFINNTPGHILVQSEINGTELVFRFF